jgi:hypothetical protein
MAIGVVVELLNAMLGIFDEAAVSSDDRTLPQYLSPDLLGAKLDPVLTRRRLSAFLAHLRGC